MPQKNKECERDPASKRETNQTGKLNVGLAEK